jgi:hypothetical protein
MPLPCFGWRSYVMPLQSIAGLCTAVSLFGLASLCLCDATLCSALPLRCVAGPGAAVQCLCHVRRGDGPLCPCLPGWASQRLRCAKILSALPLPCSVGRSHARPLLCSSPLGTAMPSLCQARLGVALPLPIHAERSSAVPLRCRGERSPALALLGLAWHCRCGAMLRLDSFRNSFATPLP